MTLARRSQRFLLLAGLLAAPVHHVTAQSSLMMAGQSSAMMQNQNLASDGLAIKGYDPVAYFTSAEPQKGLPTFSAKFGPATVLFASQANRDAFLKSPEKYMPQYGGYCAAGVAGNAKFDIDPEAWRVEDGKLYLNKNKRTQEFWLRDIPGNIVKADKNWPTLGAPTKN